MAVHPRGMEGRMDIDRRQLLVGAVCSALTGAVGGRGVSSNVVDPDLSGTVGWHPLTHSLLERARGIDQHLHAPNRAMVERTINQFSDASGWTKPLVIKWMDTPTDALDYLSRFGLDALLDMGSASFWRRNRSLESHDEEAFERAFEVRMMANELLGVEDHDRVLMAPKLLAKCRARSANLSNEETFRVRAVSSQIGWLETSMADAAAQAVANVELLLSVAASERSVMIDNQLRVFEAHEHGLLATWETADALICVPTAVLGRDWRMETWTE
jgi:hypothetical protein